MVDWHTCVNTGRTFSAIVTECVKQVALAISISPSSSDKTLSDARSLESVAIAKDAEALAFTPQPLAFALTCWYQRNKRVLSHISFKKCLQRGTTCKGRELTV